MKKKKNRILALFALVFALAALLLSTLALATAPEDQSHLVDDLYAKNQALQDRVETLEDTLEKLMTVVNLQTWSLDVKPWADSTGADVTLEAVPTSYQGGISATFLVMLDGKQVYSAPCDWDGTAFTASASLSAADGYSYYCVLTAPNGTQQLPLVTPASPNADAAVYLQSSLSAYCNLVVNDWTENLGTSLVLRDAYAQVQLPWIHGDGTIQTETSELVLRLNGKETTRIPIELSPSEVDFSYELTITNLQIAMPKLAEADSLELSLEVTLSDGRRLNALGITWQLEGGKLTSAVG